LFFDRSWRWRILLGCNGVPNVFASDLVVFLAEMTLAKTARRRIRFVATKCARESSVGVSSKIVNLQLTQTHSNIVAILPNGEVDESFVRELARCVSTKRRSSLPCNHIAHTQQFANPNEQNERVVEDGRAGRNACHHARARTVFCFLIRTPAI
jgi:hypothetical protein